jgi:hypothetical protein
MDIESQLTVKYYKSDRVYHQAWCILEGHARMMTALELVKLVIVLVLIPLTLLTFGIPYDDLVKSLVINSVASGLGVLLYGAQACCLFRDVSAFVETAVVTNHAVES